ncbi:hypothetical protein [Plasmodium yoelii yoelii]|uniref:Uncharacterized protein n=2 Tax=Plasmodium yoelii yoelii TaxID=73239 RepID=A0AAE9WT27_PLAYO|nr:hypothetical protein [Plasmodium yoelii yoelii]WBY59500.1 hypothetical protein Py17XNL_001205304 [Plasmodium yoelii yoelii]
MNKIYIPNHNDAENCLNVESPTYMDENIPPKNYGEKNSIIYDDATDINSRQGINDITIRKEFDFIFEEKIDNIVNTNKNDNNNNNKNISNMIKIDYKSIFRYAAESSSFLCAVGMWGTLEDIFRLLSKGNSYIMFFYYLFFAIIFASLTCAFNLYFNDSNDINKYTFSDLENPE